MGFKFSISELEFSYKGENYTLQITTRLAVDLEKTIGTHPLALAQKIDISAQKKEVPPIGQMAEVFEFMLKRAGARNVSFDEIYGELLGGDNASEVGSVVGQILSLFVPRISAEDIDPKPQKPRKTAKK